MPPPQPEPASLRIQLILFQNDTDHLIQTAEALIAAVALAKRKGSLGGVELAIGDCSPDRNLSEEFEDGLLSMIRNNGFDDAWYSFFAENLGSAGGSNRLAEGADTDYLLVLNPDTYPSPWMLHHMIEAFRKDIGLVEARQLPLEHPKASDPHTGDVSWASGACSMFRRSVFESVGGYDTDHFFLHCDDVDISWRIRHAGHRVILEPKATTLHHKNISLDGHIQPPYAERYYGALGKLMLATRYQANAVFENTSSWIAANGDDAQKDALTEFEKRAAEGRIPTPLPKAHKVAQFIGTEYARHRF